MGLPACASAHLQGREHLPFLFAVQKAVMVLHRDERREVVGDRVVCTIHAARVRSAMRNHRGMKVAHFASGGLRDTVSASSGFRIRR